MPKPDALSNLLEIMRDQRVGMRDRINAGVSASRVSPLSLPNESEPEAITFLRGIINYKGARGEQFSPQFRRECAAAVAYFERRAAKMALNFEVADEAERQRQWRSIINAGLRLALEKRGLRQRHDVLLTAADSFEPPSADPEAATSALLLSGNRHEQRRRQKALDERITGTWSGTEAERRELLGLIAKAVHQRLAQFGLAA